MFFKKIIFILLIILTEFNCLASKDKWDSNKKDWSDLMLSVYKGNYKKMLKLVSKQDVNYITAKGLNALEVAIRKQDTLAMNILFNCGKLQKDTSENLIMLACSYQNLSVVQILFNQHYHLINNTNGYSPLMSACSFRSKEVVNLLIEKGSNINQQRNVDGMTPLMFAVYNGKIDVVKLLISKGVNKDIQDKNGKKAIEYIHDIPNWLKVKEIDKQEIKYLLEK